MLVLARYYVTCLHRSVFFLESNKTYNSSNAFFVKLCGAPLIQDCLRWVWALSDTVSEAHPPTETTVGMVDTVSQYVTVHNRRSLREIRPDVTSI